MNTIKNPLEKEWPVLLQRPTKTYEDIERLVSDTFLDIKANGNSAIKKYTKKFDNVAIDNMLVSKADIKASINLVNNTLKDAIELAKQNIELFHKSQQQTPNKIQTTKGVTCWQEKRAIEKVGLYIPGGTAPLFSSVLMLAIPAKIAGCKEIVLCSPPDKNGQIHPAILYAAHICGVTKIYKVGGIQAIAGLTFGTETLPKVYKIFGPGNQFVTVAKQLATKYGVAIDMPAGPSELLVVADDTADASFVASDLLSQAEHGTDSQVILVSTSANFIDKVSLEITKQLQQLPRQDIATQAINNSKSILVNSKEDALELINFYGPEHFIVCTAFNDFYITNIKNAGSVFIGNYTPESAGDYASGTNHTLPTNGFTKAYSGVNLDSFTKTITFQEITKQGIANIGKSIEVMADAEGLFAHKNAVTLRLKSIT